MKQQRPKGNSIHCTLHYKNWCLNENDREKGLTCWWLSCFPQTLHWYVLVHLFSCDWRWSFRNFFPQCRQTCISPWESSTCLSKQAWIKISMKHQSTMSWQEGFCGREWIFVKGKWLYTINKKSKFLYVKLMWEGQNYRIHVIWVFFMALKIWK